MRRGRRLAGLLVVLSLAACEHDSSNVVAPIRSPSATVRPTPTSKPEVVSCIGLDVRFNKNHSANLDRKRGVLELTYHPERLKDESVAIRYRDDPSCRRNPDTRSLIQYAGAGLEIADCLPLPKTPVDGMTRVELWFGDGADPSGIAPSLIIRRDIAETDAIGAATLRAWIEGPTTREERAGAYPAAPEGSELLGIIIDEGTVVIDLNQAFEHTGLGTIYEGAILERLAGTITQFDTVDRGLLKIEGRFKEYYMGHGFIVDEEHPLTRPEKKRYRVAPRC